jgi:hypothetical protein
MNIRSFAFVVGAVGLLALAACKGESTTGAGGAGGGVGGTGGSTGGTGGGTGGTGGAACEKCAAAITDPTIDPNKLCASSKGLYDALAQCTCAGACSTQCADSVCASMPASSECTTCVQDASANGCGAELGECANDV